MAAMPVQCPQGQKGEIIMFILTTDNKIINAQYLTTIRRVYCGIEAYSPETKGAIILAMYDTEQECELAFNILIGTMKARKDLYDLSEG